MSPFLNKVLSDWIENHPGGQMTFCMSVKVCRSRKERAIGTALTKKEIYDHFGRTLSGSKWEVLHGWHVIASLVL